MTILMEYLAVTDVGSTRFGSHKTKLLKWADNEMANTVKIYKMTGKCPLVGFYMRRTGLTFGRVFEARALIGLPVEYLHPEREEFQHNVTRSKHILEMRRPGPEYVTRGELAALHKVKVRHIDSLVRFHKLEYLEASGRKWFLKTAPVLRPKYDRDKMVWAADYDACVDCGDTRRKHGGKGLCTRCYQIYLKQRKVDQVPDSAVV